jgi:16S rRNA (guanine966-N2)-methyltransferase
MRIVAGTHRGRLLKAPKGEQTRPTSDRVREAIFSILGQSLHDAAVLDLFAGSGALGIEALSRGAASATFVDSAHAAISAVADNLGALGLEGEIVRMPALRALACTPVANRQYDLVFIDPPYRLASGLGPELSVALKSVLRPTARVVTESDRRNPLLLALPLQLERRYGDTLIRIHAAR